MYVDRKRRAFFAVAGALALAGAAALPTLLVAQAPPPAPVGLSSSVQGTTVALSWAPGAGTVGPHIYQLEVGSTSGAANLVVTAVQSPGLVQPGVPNGQYFVRVRTATAAGVSAPSNEIVVQVGCVAAPAAPTGLVAQVAGNNVAIGWQPPPDATGYVLEAGSAPGMANLAVVPLGVPGLGGGGSRRHVFRAGAGGERLRHEHAVRRHRRQRARQRHADHAAPAAPVPPPPGAPFWPASLDPAILGNCSAAVHDQYAANGGDGYRYRTWHPQVESLRLYLRARARRQPELHRERRDPRLAGGAADPVRLHRSPHADAGRAQRPRGAARRLQGVHRQPRRRQRRGRVNRVYSLSVFHMGTGGPSRFSMPHHSADIA